jgi:L-fuculose-phosphate aldolase
MTAVRKPDPEAALRKALVDASLELVRRGLNEGTAGNISARHGDRMLITPSGIPPETTTTRMIAAMPLDGGGTATGPQKPSSEWRLHRDILVHRPDVGAVVHTHSTYCTVLACQHRAIPALHYMIAAFGAHEIRCTPYVPFGTQELSDLLIAHLGDGHGVLLGNHGMVTTGADLAQAMWRAVELEALARMHYLATAGGGQPALLSPDEIARPIERFAVTP